MKSHFDSSFGLALVCLWFAGSAFSQVIHVAPYNSSAKVKAAADYVCTGTKDEHQINQAISRLSDVHHQELDGGMFLGLNVEHSEQWKPTDSGTTIRRVAFDDGSMVLQIQGSDKEYPGLTQEGLSLNLEAFESFELLLHSNSAIKVRLILQDRSQHQVRYHEKVPSPGDWHRLRFYLNQPYSGSANLAEIESVQIQATSELDDCTFSISQASFTHGISLAHDRIHPTSVQVTRDQRNLEQDIDFDIDMEKGKIWLFENKPAKIGYRHGGGTIKLAPGNYRIDAASGIELRSFCDLDLHGAILTAADAYSSPGQMMQTIPNSSHTNITVRGGLLRGQRMKWPPRKNISGIVIRDASNVIIENCEIVDFNSAGVAIVNTHINDFKMKMPRRVTIANNRIANCATEYVDIRHDLYGEVGKGSDHKAMLRLAGVRDFEIRGNRIEDSFGDAKWVVACEDGIIMGNTIENSRMGSYFVERSVRVVGTANIIRNAGSRAVTIERGSHENTFSNNIILNSYREGLWLMGCSECLIQGNRFENNGWRNSEDLDSAIKIEWQSSYPKDKASFNMITNNVIKTQPHQDQAIWIASGENSKGNIVSDNLIVGARVAIRDDGLQTIAERNPLRE